MRKCFTIAKYAQTTSAELCRNGAWPAVRGNSGLGDQTQRACRAVARTAVRQGGRAVASIAAGRTGVAVNRVQTRPAVSPARGRLRRRLARWALAATAGLIAVGVAAPPVLAQGNAAIALERRVKAAFIYKFLGYTEFPARAFADPGSPITIGVVGSDAMANELTNIVAGRAIHNRQVVIREFREGEIAAAVHLLFVAGNDSVRVGRVLRAAPNAMLLVTECEDGLQQGSIINFRIVDERVRFDVSLEAADRNQVRLSSRLLTVANRVQKGMP
jgi:hypothetical protein